jgi:hypothetical protein
MAVSNEEKRTLSPLRTQTSKLISAKAQYFNTFMDVSVLVRLCKCSTIPTQSFRKNIGILDCIPRTKDHLTGLITIIIIETYRVCEKAPYLQRQSRSSVQRLICCNKLIIKMVSERLFINKVVTRVCSFAN